MLKFLKALLLFFTIGYVFVCTLVYFAQESIIFHPTQLRTEYDFKLNNNAEEIFIATEDDIELNGILYKSNLEEAKGVVVHFHGNAGNISNWNDGAKRYTNLGYDFFIYDYRGFGKSEGSIANEDQLFTDAQVVYNYLKATYPENNIIIEGYSIGSGIAAKVAATNSPRHLLLCAPYYSLVDMMQSNYAALPTFLLKYRLETNVRITEINAPITIIHGTNDQVIPFNSSERLSAIAPSKIDFIPCPNANHNNLLAHPNYSNALTDILQN